MEHFGLRRVVHTLGTNISRFRRAAGLTQHEVAKRAVLNGRHDQKIEAGEINVTINSLVGIARALDVEVVELFQAHRNGKAAS